MTVNISPVKWKYNDTVNVTKLSVTSASDDFNLYCKVQWQVLDDSSVVHDSGIIVITGTDYSNWNGSNSYPATYVANKLGVTITT
jgi:hypothetical protein